MVVAKFLKAPFCSVAKRFWLAVAIPREAGQKPWLCCVVRNTTSTHKSSSHVEGAVARTVPGSTARHVEPAS